MNASANSGTVNKCREQSSESTQPVSKNHDWVRSIDFVVE